MRLADSGFLEITNVAQLANPNFAALKQQHLKHQVSDARLKTDVTREDPAALLDAGTQTQPGAIRLEIDGRRGLGPLGSGGSRSDAELVTGSEEGGLLTVDYSKVGVIAVGAVRFFSRPRSARSDST